MQPALIALVGLAGSGKSTVAHYMATEHGYTRMRFAGALKAMTSTFLRELGVDDIEERVDGARKEEPLPGLDGVTTRWVMQSLGTEWGRRHIADDLWLRVTLKAAADRIAAGGRVVIDDCRFPNEGAAVRAAGGLVWRIERPGLVAGAHASEQAIALVEEDITLRNSRDLSWVSSLVDAALSSAAKDKAA